MIICMDYYAVPRTSSDTLLRAHLGDTFKTDNRASATLMVGDLRRLK